jgi:opacity protein-like surface antigen
MTTAARKARTITLALVTTIGCAPALAADPLGFYIGAGVGHSQVRNDFEFSDVAIPVSINGSATGWKLMAGIRPLSILGAEVAYIDFGSANGAASIPATPTQGGLNATATSHPKAAALFAVGYVPFRCRIWMCSPRPVWRS